MSVGQSKTIPAKYQAKVGRLQDGDRFYVKDDGYFAFYDYEFTGEEMRNFIKSQDAKLEVQNSAGILSVIVGDGGSSPPVAPKYGYLIISAAAAGSNMSMRLPSAHIGNILVIDGRLMNSDASVKIFASGVAGSGITGAALVGLGSVAISNLALRNDYSEAYVKMVCLEEGTWSVVEKGLTVTEAAAA